MEPARDDLDFAGRVLLATIRVDFIPVGVGRLSIDVVYRSQRSMKWAVWN